MLETKFRCFEDLLELFGLSKVEYKRVSLVLTSQVHSLIVERKIAKEKNAFQMILSGSHDQLL